VRQGPEQTDLVHHPGEPRQVFTHTHAGDARGDGPELAANLLRGRRLHVPQVDVARPAEEEEKEATVAAPPRRGGRGGGQGAQPREIGETQPKRGQGTGEQVSASRSTVEQASRSILG